MPYSWTSRSQMAVLAVTLLTMPIAFAQTADDMPLEIRGDNTVIVSAGEVYAPILLQYWLLRYLVKDPQAADYALDQKNDRAASPNFPIVKADQIPAAANVIMLATLPFLKGDALDDDERDFLSDHPGAILIRRRGRQILLVRTQQNPWDLSAPRVFLDKVCGIRMYAPDGEAEWVSTPASSTCTVGELNIRIAPVFASTTFSSSAVERNRDWGRLNSIVNQGADMRATHAIIRYFNPETYYDTHPNIYPMQKNGTRPRPVGNAWNPCLSSPMLVPIALEEIRGIMERRPTTTFLSFGVMDANFECFCTPCLASTETYNGSYSNLYYTFLNALARDVATEFPRLYLTAYVYANVRRPPVGMRIEPNIVVDLVTKSYSWSTPRLLEHEKARIESFASLGAGWVLHDWNFSGVTPRIQSRQIAAFLQWGAQNGMRGMYTEWSGQEYWYLDGAKYWVLRQLLSDPYQDVDVLWRQYCDDMFGAGSESMYRFYMTFADKYLYMDNYGQRADWPREEMVAFTPEDLASQRRLLEAATAATADVPAIQARLAVVARYFRAHELWAVATGIPGRSYVHHLRSAAPESVNREALAFYVNDDGSALRAAIDFYLNERTRAPDSNAEDDLSGLRFSYINNYSRAMGSIISAVNAKAMQGMDPSSMGREDVRTVLDRARQYLRENLPAESRPDKVATTEALVTKTLWIPQGKSLLQIDGRLDEPAWQEAAVLEDWTQADLLLPTDQGNTTRGYIMRSGDQLVIGLVCEQPSGIWAETTAEVETGTRIWRESCTEIFFGPAAAPGEKPVYAQYIVNANGAFRAFQAAKDNRRSVQCAAVIHEDGKGYTVEMSLPLKVDGLYDFTGGRALAFTIMRQVYPSEQFNPSERLGWFPLFGTAHKPESRGLVILE